MSLEHWKISLKKHSNIHMAYIKKFKKLRLQWAKFLKKKPHTQKKNEYCTILQHQEEIFNCINKIKFFLQNKTTTKKK